MLRNLAKCRNRVRVREHFCNGLPASINDQRKTLGIVVTSRLRRTCVIVVVL